MLTTSNPNTAAKATFYRTADGGLYLARVQHITGAPRFRPAGWEEAERMTESESLEFAPEYWGEAIPDIDLPHTPSAANRARAVRRARLLAYDLIQCNPDLNAFATFTYSPEAVDEKTDWGQTYAKIRSWFSNGVQRDGLRYIAVPELTKRGDVHFHAICNADALRLEKAFNPHNGKPIKHNGAPVYNITNWHAGFSTAQIIERRNPEDDTTDAVARYIFKYMTKNAGAKIGGRYCLKGGRLALPLYDFADDPRAWITAEPLNTFTRDLPNGDRYTCYDFGKPKTV